MRKAAGILMIIVGVALLALYVGLMSEFGIDFSSLSFNLFIISLSIIILPVLFITGGAFCLKRKYWKVCFTLALLPVVIMFSWVCWSRFSPYLAWFWFLIPMGIPAIIFVYLRKREWQEPQA